jgi:1-acyl-sn-glycerol-3-phosphate acyltransferase
MPPRERPKPSRIVRAYKHGWPRLAVHAMALRKLRAGFASAQAQGLDRLRGALDADPSGVLLLANHSCWWDLFFAHLLNESIPVDGYGMMEHFNLRRFGFFRRIGAFSVDRTDPRSVRESLGYTAELLARPRAGVWVFPQGAISPNDARPIRFQPGLRALLRRAGRLRIVPVALRYEFWQDERPEALARFGEPTWVDRSEADSVLSDWEGRLTAELDALRGDSLAQAADRFTPLLRGRGSISDRYARLRARFLGATPGAPEPRP